MELTTRYTLSSWVGLFFWVALSFAAAGGIPPTMAADKFTQLRSPADDLPGLGPFSALTRIVEALVIKKAVLRGHGPGQQLRQLDRYISGQHFGPHYLPVDEKTRQGLHQAQVRLY
jgi:hypothetical protein